jgi:hypothetical protein
MAVQSVLKPSIIVYTVGDDISQETYNTLLLKLGDWFAESRNTKEPVALAKMVVDACLAGKKPKDGTPWESAATAPLARRIRMAAQFDMDTMSPMKTASQKQKDRKAKAKERKLKKRAEGQVDQHYPAEYEALGSAAEASYGDDPRVFFTTQERKNFAEKRAALLKKFPQLDNVAQDPKVQMYVTTAILFERATFRTLATGAKKGEVKATEFEMNELTKRLLELEKAMGIDPVTLSKTQKDKEGGTVGEAIRRFEAMPNYRELRLREWAEEMLLLYMMFMQPSPRTDMDGYQLDEVGLYGLTKTRVVECPHCGEKNWSGLKLAEIEAWLLEHGYLKPVEGKEPGAYLTREASA